MNPDVKWTYLCRTEVKDKLEKRNIFVSKHIVKMLFHINQFKKRKISKKGTIKEIVFLSVRV